MGNRATREMNANPGVVYRNRGNVTAGRICGMIATILIIVGVAFFALIVLFAAAGA
jgi:hypothetical protein